MDKKNYWLTFLAIIASLVIGLITELFPYPKDRINAYIISVITCIILALIIYFSEKIISLISKMPDGWVLLRDILIRILRFIQSPFAKYLLILLLLMVLSVSTNIFTKILTSFSIFLLYFSEVNKNKSPIFLTQSKEHVVFQDSFNKGLSNWSTTSGSAELEINFGNPAPDLLLKQTGRPSGQPQTFVLLKNKKITKHSTVECDVYIEPNTIFNLVFGVTDGKPSYFMARLDTRVTEFDALLYNPEDNKWDFVKRSNKYRTLPHTWYRLRVDIISNKKIEIYKNGEIMISEVVDFSTFGRIGFMNEEGDVHVDNVVITEM